MHRGGSEGSGAGRHKSRRPRLGDGNATPPRGERVPGARKRPSSTRLRHISKVSRTQNPDIPLSRRCHFQDVQYHFFRARVSVGKVNVYKVEAPLNRYPPVSRPRQFFVLLTEVDTCLLCALNHSHRASAKITIARELISMRFSSCCNPSNDHSDANRCEGCAGRKTTI
jgi:hypothetical protein